MTSERSLPCMWRPRALTIVVAAVGAGVLISMLGMWFGLPGEERAKFSMPQVATLLVFLVALLIGLYGVGRTRLVASETGLLVVNVFAVHRLEWAQIIRVNFRTGDPWVVLDIDDGTTVSVMALQSADGARARRSVTELMTLVQARTRTARDD